MKRALHFSTKLNSRDIKKCDCFWLPSYDLFASARKAVGSFSIVDSDDSENVTSEVNWRFFKVFRVYSNSLKMSKVGKFL